MHAIAEIVIPPGSDVEKAVKEVMEYFCDEGEHHADWWDFYIIGGRFGGHKVQASLDPEMLKKFHDELTRRKVTVFVLVCGKEELQPKEQIPMVDALWREFFPGKGEKCLLFAHSSDQYRKDGFYPEDVCTVGEVPERLECERLIVAGQHWDDKAKLEPKRMLATSYWNRVEHQDSDFSGNVKVGIERIRNDEKEHKKLAIGDDWLVVTVDYHN